MEKDSKNEFFDIPKINKPKINDSEIDEASELELADKIFKENGKAIRDEKGKLIDIIDDRYFKVFLDEIDELKKEVDIKKVENILGISIDKVREYIDYNLADLIEKVNDAIEEDKIRMGNGSSFEAVLLNSSINAINGVKWIMENIDSNDPNIQDKINDSTSNRRQIAAHFKKFFHQDMLVYYIGELCADNKKLSSEITSKVGYLSRFKKYFYSDKNCENKMLGCRKYPLGGYKLPYFRFFSELEKGNITPANIDEELSRLKGRHIKKSEIRNSIIMGKKLEISE